jgi:hypothetical protein
VLPFIMSEIVQSQLDFPSLFSGFTTRYQFHATQVLFKAWHKISMSDDFN